MSQRYAGPYMRAKVFAPSPPSRRNVGAPRVVIAAAGTGGGRCDRRPDDVAIRFDQRLAKRGEQIAGKEPTGRFFLEHNGIPTVRNMREHLVIGLRTRQTVGKIVQRDHVLVARLPGGRLSHRIRWLRDGRIQSNADFRAERSCLPQPKHQKICAESLFTRPGRTGTWVEMREIRSAISSTLIAMASP